MNELRPQNQQSPLSGPERAELEQQIKALLPDHGVKKVLLVTPPDAESSIFRFETAKRGRYTNYPPYGLGVVARRLQAGGTAVEMCNLNHEVLKAAYEAGDEQEFDHQKTWESALAQCLEDFDPDLVGVTCMFTMTHRSLKEVCDFIADKGYPIAAGGVHISNDVEFVLNDIPVVDFAFLREAEIAFANFVDFANDNATIDDLGQIVISIADGGGSEKKHVRLDANVRPEIDAIDTTPAYDLMNVREYSTYGTIGAFYCFKPKDTVFATVLSNRGCRAQCTFCSVRNFNGVGVRGRDPISVVDEIDLLASEYGVRHIMWLDDDLLKDHARAMRMFGELERRNLGVTWDATNGLIASSCRDEIVDAMARSGCIAINLGMESGNRDILRQIRKPGTLENFLSAAEVFRKYPQIHTSVLLMLGFPGETFQMIQDTIDVAKEMNCDWYRISPLQPLPNTPIYDSMVEQGLLKSDDRSNVRFAGGAYGKQNEIEQGVRAASNKVLSPFEVNEPTAIPDHDQITDIWFYMNFHLNFHRLFHERRPEKIEQMQAHLATITDVIAPENGFALYFLGFFQYLTTGAIDQNLVTRLKDRLETSEYWAARMPAFGLSPEHLETCQFPAASV